MSPAGGPGERVPPADRLPQVLTARPRSRRAVVSAVAAVVVALDQATKAWALWALADGPVELAAGARLYLVYNRGAAFGLGGDIVPVLAVVALVVVAVVAFRGDTASEVPLAVALGGVLGGAVGNLVDRFARGSGLASGAVVDFIDLGWWPVFNLADMAITLGAVALVVAGLRGGREAR